MRNPLAWRNTFNLDFYREEQQDCRQDSWEGLVAAIDGSVNRSDESMGAGYVIGAGQAPDVSLAYAVGGPLSSLRSEAAALHGLLEFVTCAAPLLVITDCLSLLYILSQWG